jgi:hypothetical protein
VLRSASSFVYNVPLAYYVLLTVVMAVALLVVGLYACGWGGALFFKVCGRLTFCWVHGV